MRWPPPLPEERKDAAMAAIRRRHADDDSPLTYLLHSDDPDDVLKYLRRRGVQQLRSDDDGGDDVRDAMILRAWEIRRTAAEELWFLKAGEQRKVNRRMVGEPLGITTGQGVVDRITWVEKGLAGPGDDTPPLPVDQAIARQRWLDIHREQVHAAARALVEHRGLVDDATYDLLIEVRDDLTAGACNHSSMTYLQLAAEALEPFARTLGEEHPLRVATAAAATLTSEYFAIR